MIDNYLLEELVVFKETKTLAETAKKLNLTQPSVTRGMQKLESELGITLFERRPNRITLTKTGEFAAVQAQKVLERNQELVLKIQNFARSHEIIRIGMTIPGPLIVLNMVKAEISDKNKIEIERLLQNNDEVIKLLEDHTFSLIFSNQKIMTNVIESYYVGIERLIVNLNQFLDRSNQETITFKELQGLSFIVLRAIGPWSKIIQQSIPDATFMYQEEEKALVKLTEYSNFPYFTTNLTNLSAYRIKNLSSDRVSIPISDSIAQMRVYVSYLKDKRSSFLPLIKQVAKAWPR